YDPMIAKLVTHGPDRESAIRRMQAALDAFHIRGIRHNIDFLSAVVGHPRFREGRLSTNFIAEEFPEGFTGGTLAPGERQRLVAVAAFVGVRREFRGEPPAEAVARTVFLEREPRPVRISRSTDGLVVRGEGFESEVQGS